MSPDLADRADKLLWERCPPHLLQQIAYKEARGPPDSILSGPLGIAIGLAVGRGPETAEMVEGN